VILWVSEVRKLAKFQSSPFSIHLSHLFISVPQKVNLHSTLLDLKLAFCQMTEQRKKILYLVIIMDSLVCIN